jgi:hypothetical protein
MPASRASAVACALAAGCALVAAVAGCGAAPDRPAPGEGVASAGRPAPRPVPAGHGAAFRLPPRGGSAARGRRIGGAVCRADVGPRVQAHLELFARGRVVPVPPGIGIAPPLRRDGAYVRAGRCSYPLRTTEPTGLIELRPRRGATLGELFAIWGQPLSRTRLGPFRAAAGQHVRAYLDGARWRADPRAIPLRRHAQVALALGPPVPVHARYAFPR